MAGLIIAVVTAVFLAGAGVKLYGAGKSAGATECREAVAAKQAELDDAAGKLKQEAANHIDDMVTAYEQGEKEAAPRVIYRQAKGAEDVKNHPALSSAACAITPDMVRNVNAGLLGMRRKPPADGVRNDAGSGEGAPPRSTADPAGTPHGVRGSDGAAGRDTRRPLPKAAGDRRPVGPLH